MSFKKIGLYFLRGKLQGHSGKLRELNGIPMNHTGNNLGNPELNQISFLHSFKVGKVARNFPC